MHPLTFWNEFRQRTSFLHARAHFTCMEILGNGCSTPHKYYVHIAAAAKLIYSRIYDAHICRMDQDETRNVHRASIAELILRVCYRSARRIFFPALFDWCTFWQLFISSPNTLETATDPFRRIDGYCATYIRYYSIIEYPRDTQRYRRGAFSLRCDGVAKRLVLTYSLRIYLDRRKPQHRTAPSRYFSFYDSSTYDAFKPVDGEEHAARHAESFQPPFSGPKTLHQCRDRRHFLAVL